MLKREIFIGLLIAVFSLGLIGVALADDAGHDNFDPTASVYIEQDTMATAEFTQPTAIELEHGNLDVRSRTIDSAPLVCVDDRVQEPDLIASNDCTDLFDDLYRG
jgi:hypothetical protein